MSKKIIAANWKSQGNLITLSKTAQSLSSTNINPSNTVILALPAPFLYFNLPLEIKKASQNISDINLREKICTAEISPEHLLETKTEYVIIGHSERRNLKNEGSESLRMQLENCLFSGIKPIFCVGESMEIYKKGEDETKKFLQNELKDLIEVIGNYEKMKDSVIIAYEPIFAIGTGETAEKEYIDIIISFLRKNLEGEKFNQPKILYGGSVSSTNCESLIEVCDGFLIGKASLGEDFIKIIEKLN